VGTRRAPVVVDEDALNIFTDGSSFSGPRRGGIAFRLVTVDEHGNEVHHDFQPPGFQAATNQQMELMACKQALRLIAGRHSPVSVENYKKVIIYTDSIYVAENFKSAKFTWPKMKWLTRDGNPVLNAGLWKDLIAAVRKVNKKVEIQWRKGHSASNPHNRDVDKLAKASAKGPLRKPVSVSRVRRKLTTKSTELGSIKPEGQQLAIRIITDAWLPEQQMYAYKCEVTSKDSAYFGNVDNYFSDIMLNAGHEYSVRLNDDPRSPRIEHNYGEIESDH
jgi:ribonuclease HI